MKHVLSTCVVVALASLGPASAQETTSGSLSGVAVDTTGAVLPGATVSLTSAQGVKSFVTDTEGRFFAPYLTPGRYTVRVDLSGFSPVERKDVDVRLGQRIELSFTLRVGGVEEVVTVVGASPVVDVSSTTVGAVLDSDALKRLPVGRNFTDTLYLVPGVSSSGSLGAANPSVSGASGLENSYTVDGVNITNAGFGAIGSYSIAFGSLGTGVTTDFIKETQVKTAGFEAEYGQSTGGVVNVVTQSGTNAFHGSVFGYLRPPELESEFEQLETERGTVNTTGTRNIDFGVSVGGPVVKDKVFFFGAFNPQYQRRTFIAPQNRETDGGFGFPLAALGEVNRDRKISSYAGKLTWQVSPSHRIDASVFGDPSKGDMGPQRAGNLASFDDPGNPAGFSELSSYGGHNQVVRYDGIMSRNWLVEASVARAYNTLEEVPKVDEWRFTDNTVPVPVTRGGLGYYDQGNEGTNLQLQLKSTNIFDLAGNHQVRYGVAFEDIAFDSTIDRTGPTFTLPNGVPTTTGASVTILEDLTYGRIYRVTRANYVSTRDTTQKYLSFFLQDTWQVSDKLTLRPGVRYEQQRLQGSEELPLCHADDSLPGAGDGTGALIPCSFKWDNNWAPRLGATYDIRGDGKSKLFASWGRFYAKVPNDLAARAMAADAGVSRADYFDAQLTEPVPEGTTAAGVTRHFIPAGVYASIIDPDSKSTYQDEMAGGVEFEVARNFSVGVRYIRRTMPRILEDIGTAQVALYDLGVPGLDSVEYFLTNISRDTPAFAAPSGIAQARFEDPEHTYQSVEVTANKHFADNWSVIASYRWSRLEGNFEGFYRNDNGQSDPGITSLFDFPTNDPSYTQVGVPQFGYRGDIRYLGCTLGCGILPNDRTHQLKVYGNRTFGDLNVGVGYNGGSGQPLTPLAALAPYDNPGEIPEAQRGSGIQTMDGFKERTPFEHIFDFHADWTFKLGDQRVVFLADVFNVLDRQEPTFYDTFTELSFQVENPNYGQPLTVGGGRFPSYQTPRQIRLGARFEW